MAKGPQGWVKCADHLPYYKDNSPAACHDSMTPRLARTSAGAPGLQGPLDWGSWGFNAARGRCSGQLRSSSVIPKHALAKRLEFELLVGRR
jgi:hypothetical protein